MLIYEIMHYLKLCYLYVYNSTWNQPSIIFRQRQKVHQHRLRGGLRTTVLEYSVQDWARPCRYTWPAMWPLMARNWSQVERDITRLLSVLCLVGDLVILLRYFWLILSYEFVHNYQNKTSQWYFIFTVMVNGEAEPNETLFTGPRFVGRCREFPDGVWSSGEVRVCRWKTIQGNVR